jgi:hypothetical protein
MRPIWCKVMTFAHCALRTGIIYRLCTCACVLHDAPLFYSHGVYDSQLLSVYTCIFFRDNIRLRLDWRLVCVLHTILYYLPFV